MKSYIFIILFPVQVFCTASKYFPLHQDNNWTFQSKFLISIQTYHENIVETTSFEGVEYYKFDNFRNATNVWTGISGEQVLTLVGNKAYTLYDFGAEEGSTWLAPDPPSSVSGRIKLVSKTEKIDTPAGSFSNCYRFSHRIDDSNSYEEWFAAGVGLVKREIKLMGGLIEAVLIDYSVNTTNVHGFKTQKVQNFYLYANYPNPFNASTTIGISVPEPDAVRIQIVGPTGRLVDIITDSFLPAGEHRFTWTALQHATGTYWIIAKLGPETAVRKILLQK
ncbi:hypothetical protein JW935_24440 [candidate division KSB1 bacterium]|nr:hypothetical protein [candidate division KSB1 bacterium]